MITQDNWKEVLSFSLLTVVSLVLVGACVPEFVALIVGPVSYISVIIVLATIVPQVRETLPYKLIFAATVAMFSSFIYNFFGLYALSVRLAVFMNLY